MVMTSVTQQPVRQPNCAKPPARWPESPHAEAIEREAQIPVASVRQRLELAITKADCLLAGHAQESWSRDGSNWLDTLRELCAEIVEAARDYLYAAQSAEGPQPPDMGADFFPWLGRRKRSGV